MHKRKLLIALLAFGTIAGFGHGFASMSHWHHHQRARRAAFEQHVAAVCVDAARRVDRAEAPYDRPPPMTPQPPPRQAPPAYYPDDYRPEPRRHHHRGHAPRGEHPRGLDDGPPDPYGYDGY